MENFLEFKLSENDKQIVENMNLDNIFTQEEIDEISNYFKDSLKNMGLNEEQIKDIDEGFLGKVVGGLAGFVIGPKIGRIIAKALGIEKGILYDMFNSKLVGAALGSAIVKNFGKKK